MYSFSESKVMRGCCKEMKKVRRSNKQRTDTTHGHRQQCGDGLRDGGGEGWVEVSRGGGAWGQL